MPPLDASGQPIATDSSVYDAVRVVSTRRTVLVRSQTQVEDVEEIGAETTRHGVFFLRYVPYQNFADASALVLVAPIGYAIDSALDLPEVVGAQFVQEVDDSGLLTNAMEFTVQWIDPDPAHAGPYTDSFIVSLQAIYNGDAWYSQIGATVQTIQATVTQGA